MEGKPNLRGFFRKLPNWPMWVKVLVAITLLLIIGIGIYGYSVYHSVTIAIESMHQPTKKVLSEKRISPVTLPKKDPFSVLLLGVDERKGDRGRSDTIIVLTVNPSLNSIKMLSIPRDTRTNIVGKNMLDKINHAYAFGGVDMAIDTVENFLDIPIDYYTKVNMENFKDIVDAVGGVTVQNDLDFTSSGIHFAKGEIHLNGEKALSYARMRYEDPKGDFGRQNRQRQIIQSILHEGISLSLLNNYDDILAALSKMVKTNLTFNNMMDIQKNYMQAVKNINQITIDGSGTEINGIYYFSVPEEEKQRIQHELKNHLGI